MGTHRARLFNTAVNNNLKEFKMDLAKIFHVCHSFYFVSITRLTVIFISVNHNEQYFAKFVSASFNI